MHTLHGETYQQKVGEIAERRDWWRGKLRYGWIALLFAASVLSYAGVWSWVNADEVKRLHLGFLMTLGPVTLLVVAVLMMKSTADNASNTFSYVSTQVKGSGGGATTRSEIGHLDGDHIDGKPRLFHPVDASDSMFIAGQDEALIREHFPETLLWRPQVITDDAGRPEVDLTFADSITTWRLTATAVDPEGRPRPTHLP